jgi:hypothetical protein
VLAGVDIDVDVATIIASVGTLLVSLASWWHSRELRKIRRRR